MNYKLILLKDSGNILVNEEEIKLGDTYFYRCGSSGLIDICQNEKINHTVCKKVIAGIDTLLTYSDEVKQILRDKYGWSSMEDLYKSPNMQNKRPDSKSAERFDDGHFYGFEDGWKAHQSITNKRFSEKDMRKALLKMFEFCTNTENFTNIKVNYGVDNKIIQSLQQPIQLKVDCILENNVYKITKILTND